MAVTLQQFRQPQLHRTFHKALWGKQHRIHPGTGSHHHNQKLNQWVVQKMKNALEEWRYWEDAYHLTYRFGCCPWRLPSCHYLWGCLLWGLHSCPWRLPSCLLWGLQSCPWRLSSCLALGLWGLHTFTIRFWWFHIAYRNFWHTGWFPGLSHLWFGFLFQLLNPLQYKNMAWVHLPLATIHWERCTGYEHCSGGARQPQVLSAGKQPICFSTDTLFGVHVGKLI